MQVNGQLQWVAYEVAEENPDDFGEIGAAFDAAHQVVVRQINNAEVRFFRQRLVVDSAVEWIKEHRRSWT